MVRLAGILTRVLAALCAAPLVVGWQVGVAYLEAHVLPSTLLFVALSLLGIGPAVLVGLIFAMTANPDVTVPEPPGEALARVAGFTLAVAVVATVTVASTWAFASVAERHDCTVTALETVEEPAPMTGSTREIPVVRLTCTDGREDAVGGSPVPLGHHSWRFWDDGDQVQVAYDPRGDLPSRAADDLHTPVRNWVLGISTGLTALLHALIVVLAARGRQGQAQEARQDTSP